MTKKNGPPPMPKPIAHHQVALLPTTGRGKELMDMLLQELAIPRAGLRWFEVRFAMSEAITVTLQYAPTPPTKEPDA